MEQKGRALALVGPGRAGTTIAAALVRQGWDAVGLSGRAPDAPSTLDAALRLDAPVRPVHEVAAGADVVIVATPDRAISDAALAASPSIADDALVVHLSGAQGIDVLAGVRGRHGALHPLQSIPSVDVGVERLPGSWCAVAGDPQVHWLAEQIGLHPFVVGDADRARYHAAACIASNHLVALLGQVERVAATAGVPLDAYLSLVRATVDNVDGLGPARALTGPVMRGDLETLREHLEALDPSERDAYRALARAAARLAGNEHVVSKVLG